MTPPETDVEQKDCFAGPVLLDDPQSLELFQRVWNNSADDGLVSVRLRHSSEG